MIVRLRLAPLLAALAVAVLCAAPALADPTAQLAIGGALVSASNPLPVTLEGAPVVTANQGTPAAVGSAWPTYLALGGAAVAAGNPLPITWGAGVGAVTVNQGSPPWSVTLPDLEAPLAPGAAPAKGLPVLCQYESTLPAPTTGQTVACQSDASGRLITALGTALPAGANTIGNVGQAGTWTVEPGNTANTTPWLMTAQREQWNGSAWEPVAGNLDTGALVTLTNAATGVNSADQTNADGRGLMCLVKITAISGTSPTLTVEIDYKDTASNTYSPLLVSPAYAVVGVATLTVYPGIPAVANTSANNVLPRTWRIADTIGGTSPSITGTVGCSVIR